MFMAVSWLVDGGVFPERVDSESVTCKCETLSPLLMVAGWIYSVVQMLGHGSLWSTGH